MSRFLFTIVLAFLLVVAGCRRGEQAPGYPVGLWEYQGELGDGRQIAMRVSVDHGPFVRGVGYVVPVRPLSEEAYLQLLRQIETSFAGTPEMLMRYEKGGFYGIGSDFDGELFYEWSPVDSVLISHHGASSGVVLEKVEEFRPLALPHYERVFGPSVQPHNTEQRTTP